MKRPLWISLLESILAVIPIVFLAGIAYFFIALLGGFQFYAPLTVVVAAALAVYIVCSIFGWFTPRIRRIAFACFAGLCLLATGGYELNKAYVNSLAEVSEKEISLEQYQPFHADSKIAGSVGQPPIRSRARFRGLMGQRHFIRYTPPSFRPYIRRITTICIILITIL